MDKPHIRKAKGNGDRWIVEKPHKEYGAQMQWVESFIAARSAALMIAIAAWKDAPPKLLPPIKRNPNPRFVIK